MTTLQVRLAVTLFLCLVLAGVMALLVQRGDGRSVQSVASANAVGERLTITWMGALCEDTSARVQVRETATAVDVEVRARQSGTCNECLCAQTISTTLDSELGQRVVTAGGRPVRVE